MPRFKYIETAPAPERALVVGVDTGRGDWHMAESLDELERLVTTADGVVVGRETQKLDSPSPRTFVGSGKAEEIAAAVRRLDADVVVFDDELSPSQQSNLERIFGDPVKVIDRTALILDIFGRHAKTREGRLQVQLAQLQYLLPRLRGMWSHLMGEQTRGGIGSRFGQGESQLEVDRRLVRDRISALKRELLKLETRRETQSKARWDSGIWCVALAGYTNAGKSTLLNALTDSGVYAKDELFATLDPTTRSIDLAEGRKITITDTVGFIQKLPTGLIESFKSTLAEVNAADLVLEVVDASDSNWEKKRDAVNEILDQIGAKDIRRVLVFNKCDLLAPDDLSSLRVCHPDAVFVSAEEETGLAGLLHRIAEEASAGDTTLTVLIPYEKGILMKMVHERCQVIREQYQGGGLLITARVSARMVATLAPYQVGGSDSI
ncbi:GTPase HflX [uncultured Parolsenella sp.]|uniref:GTPase HflX n=1 Tax=uncultured Parolsenella sp. TaxID=2083008 RepID=UPI0025FCEED3|nr:GTPase HflX [uncultured Parolsenella sp.]